MQRLENVEQVPSFASHPWRVNHPARSERSEPCEQGLCELDRLDRTGRFSADGKYELDWGPYHYSNLAPGVSSVSGMFEAAIGAPADETSIANAGTGKVTTLTVTVRLR